MNEGYKVLSLFNGMGCIWIALDRLGIKVSKRYASEIDKYANIVNDANYPDTIHLGDATKVSPWGLETIDLLVGGSPCQGFSFAGKGLNFEDPRSKLFFEFVRIYEEARDLNPKVKFLLENVKMKKEHQDIISGLLGVQPIEINSALVSAQNRRRLYWTNIEGVMQPGDRGVLLKDILQPEDEIEEKYYLKNSDRTAKSLIRINDNVKNGGEKANCLLSSMWKGSASNGMTNIPVKLNKDLTPKTNQEKASCLTGGAHSGGNHSDMGVIALGCVKFARTEEAKRIRKESMANGKDYTPFNMKEISAVDYDKMNTITTAINKDNILTDGFRLRRLTPIECERLQTVPDNCTNYVSNTQRYKMLGNGWTVDVIAHILSSFVK